jgi:hypothetical protein
MTRRVRIGLKVAVATVLILLLLLTAQGSVDFVYTGF